MCVCVAGGGLLSWLLQLVRSQNEAERKLLQDIIVSFLLGFSSSSSSNSLNGAYSPSHFLHFDAPQPIGLCIYSNIGWFNPIISLPCRDFIDGANLVGLYSVAVYGASAKTCTETGGFLIMTRFMCAFEIALRGCLLGCARCS